MTIIKVIIKMVVVSIAWSVANRGKHTTLYKIGKTVNVKTSKIIIVSSCYCILCTPNPHACTCTHTHMHACMHANTHAHTQTHTQTHTHKLPHPSPHTHACTDTGTHTHTHSNPPLPSTHTHHQAHDAMTQLSSAAGFNDLFGQDNHCCPKLQT